MKRLVSHVPILLLTGLGGCSKSEKTTDSRADDAAAFLRKFDEAHAQLFVLETRLLDQHKELSKERPKFALSVLGDKCADAHAEFVQIAERFKKSGYLEECKTLIDLSQERVKQGLELSKLLENWAATAKERPNLFAHAERDNEAYRRMGGVADGGSAADLTKRRQHQIQLAKELKSYHSQTPAQLEASDPRLPLEIAFQNERDILVRRFRLEEPDSASEE